MKPREAAEGGAGKRSARGGEDGRKVVGIAKGAANAASTLRQTTGLGTGLIEQMIDSENLNLAWRKVKANKGAAGVDGLGIEQTATHLRSNWQRIEAELLAGGVPAPAGAPRGNPEGERGHPQAGSADGTGSVDTAVAPSGDRPAV